MKVLSLLQHSRRETFEMSQKNGGPGVSNTRDSQGSGYTDTDDEEKDMQERGLAWNARKQHSQESGSDSDGPMQFDDARGFGQHKPLLEPGLDFHGQGSSALKHAMNDMWSSEDDAQETIFQQVQSSAVAGFKMTVLHSELLVLISKYSAVEDDVDSWFREMPLMVLAYEGIIAGVFEMDYSPVCLTVSHGGITRRLLVNYSQEAKCCIDELREQNMIATLKISTEDFQSSTAFKISGLGTKFLKVLNFLTLPVQKYKY